MVKFTKKRIQRIIPLREEEVANDTMSSAKYFGVMIDRMKNFTEQIQHIADKASRSVSSLGKLMTKASDVRFSRLRLLLSFDKSVL